MTTKDRRILIFLIFLFSRTKSQYLDNVDVISAINLQPTPVLEPGRETDVATVLLVDNNDRGSHGRFLNVKPSVGLITSTARTFIQEGITTEYATQVLGTTLDNGRLYAQLLSKSTRVLYDNNDNRKSVYMNEVLPQRNNWRLDDELVLQSTRSFIKNTDDYGQNNPAFLVYPSQTVYNKIPVYEEYTYNKEVSNVKSVYNNNNNNNNNNESDQTQTVQDNKNIKPNKIQAENTLPTFTVKNEFAPSVLSYDGGVSNNGVKQVPIAPQLHIEKSSRIGKNVVQSENNVIRIQPLPEVKSLTSITYYGFADFTTIVGDTVIIFSPSTVNSLQNTHITSITGEATLNDHKKIKATTIVKSEIKPTTVKFSDNIINNRINTEIHESYNVQSNFILEGDHDDSDYDTITVKMPEMTTNEHQQETEAQPEIASTQEAKQEEEEEDEEEGEEDEEGNEQTSTVKDPEKEQINVVTEPTEVEEKLMEEVADQINSPEIIIEPSETQTATTPMLSTPSNEDISKIFESLASVKAQQELENQRMSLSSQEIDPHPQETQVLGGVTTIFFEDDPFAQFEQPSQMETNSDRQDKHIEFEPEITTENLPDQTTVDEDTETTIGEDEITTTVTETNDPEETTLQEITESVIEAVTTPKLKLCDGPLKLIPSTVYKTLTFLTTFFIPIEDENGVESISTSVKTDRMETSDIAYNLPTDCYYENISPTNIQLLGDQATADVAEITTKPETTSNIVNVLSIETSTLSSSENKETTNIEDPELEDTTTEIMPTTTEKNDPVNEIELIYKTLYTTYTYLTTFFHDTTSSISSRKEVVTNIVSSTLNSLLLKTDDAVANLVSGMSGQIDDIKPTAAIYNGDGAATITNNFIINENELAGIDNIIHDKDKIGRPTPVLNGITEQSNIRTYYTTYTYFTTIFVDKETEISSRTEVYTNYVNVEPTKHEIDNNLIQKYSTMLRNSAGEKDDANEEEVIRMVTDVKSSSSNGDRSYIEEELDDQLSSESNREETVPEPSLLLLQTSYTTFTFFTTMYVGSTSSNVLSRLETITNVVTEKIKPTETIDLLNTANSDRFDLPITYFTTFTYWTTLFKDNRTITTSREETISNVVEPTSVVQENIVTTQVTQILETAKPNVIIETSHETQNVDLTQTLGVNIEPTTYYTTYTYFTTSYIGDETVLNSRFETFTNIITPSIINGTQGESRAIKIDSNLSNQILDSAIIKPSKPIINETEVINNRFDASDPSSSELVSINYGKIIDADGVSTLYYTTKAFGTLINNELSQIIESTSSLNIDEQKKSSLAELANQNNETASVPGNKNHKTGLVRSIDGTIIANRTTTLYQSKIIGTNIDGRYAQIIVSTTSFLIEKTPSPLQGLNINIKPTKVIDSSDNIMTNTVLVTTPTVLEPSIDNGGDNGSEEGFDFENEGDGDGEEDEEGDEDDDGTNQKKKSRLTFQTRKRTFTPVIRPFASRNRPTFNPKRKNVNPTAATISRSDFTPTITATPALKNEGQSRGRFSVNRNSNRNSLSTNIQPTVDPGLSGNRRFARPRINSTGNNNNISPTSGSYNGGGGSTRLRSTIGANRIQPTATGNFGGSSRRGGFRGSSSNLQNRPAIGGSSQYTGNTRFNRIRPSSVNQFDRSALSTGFTSTENTSPNPNEQDEDFLTTYGTEDPTDFTNDEPTNFDTTTAETLRRNQNPLLRFRRPKIGGANSNNSPNGLSTTTTRPLITTRKSALLGRNRNINKVSTTTTSTTTSRPRVNNLFQRPTNLIGLQNRNRPANKLFPARTVANRGQSVQNPDEDLQNGDLPEDDDNIENDQDNDDTYYDASEEDVVTEQATTDATKTRIKRQVEYGTRSSNFSPRFRRPTTSRNKVVEEVEKIIEEPPPTPKHKSPSNRYSLSGRSRNQGNTNQPAVTPRIRPTSASNSNSRPQFTLREKDVSVPTKASNFRRPTTNSRRKPTSVTTTRPKTNNNNSNNNNNNSRLRGYSSTESAARTSNPRARTTASSRGRGNNGANNNFSRQRTRQQDFDVAYVQPSFDGTIVITHHIPTEVTIPVINGKNTEYKNIVTAKISLETIGPQQYSTSVRENGISVLVLANDVTGVNANGATEITQFILNETPTTSVIFTPTTIRGRKTSYSHIIPSTIFDVDRVVTTIQPQIAANAPLANILLSQLLLGNLNQNINPLLALQQQQQQQQQIPATKTTELKTKTTTYVTTVTNSISTILPLTFRGKEILTTIVDTSVEVITATEFITETIVVQPTLQPQNQQLNSLLLPLLLQQQQQVQPQAQQQIRQQTSPQQSLLDVLSFEADYNFDDAFKLNLGIGDGAARPNLATRIMSNGVEVIVAGDKSKMPGVHGNVFRILSNSVYKNHMLAPTTLKDHMMLMIPFGSDQNYTNIELASAFLYPNQFVTKTCLTTFTYLKTYIVQGESRVESHEKVISNIATEQKNYVKVEPTAMSQIILSKIPNLAVGTLHTTYTYLNTVHDDIPVVITSKHTVTNTITAPDDYLSLLQPSEYATPITDVNTYYNTIELTKTLSDDLITKQITTKETVTQVIITESLPQIHFTPLQATVHQSVDDLDVTKTNDVFKTYFVTYTYYNTFLENNNRTIIQTNVSTTSQVNTEKIYLYPSASQYDVYKTSLGDHNLHLYGTKTYFTKFTFFTTLANSNDGIHGSPVVTSNMRVIENVITESIPMNRLDGTIVDAIRKQLMTRDAFVTSVRLRDGENINVTAINLIASSKINHILNTDKILEASPEPITVQGLDDNSEDTYSISDEQSGSIDSSEDNLADGSDISGVVADPASENVSNLINSLRLPSLPSFNALGPMINAVAGLIQNNFGRRNSSRNQAPIALPLTQQLNEGPENYGPIYIPVNGIVPSEGTVNELLHINKFGPITEKWVNEEDQRKKVEIVIGKPTHEASLVNGGIPISPGDVITANSDVIIGKPAVIGPRVPTGLNSYADSTILQPPPLPSPIQHTSAKGIPFIRNQISFVNQNPISYPIRNVINPQSPSQSRPLFEDDKLSIIGSNGGLFDSNNMKPNEIFNHLHDEIIEIRKIPEVFSTDLPAIHINNYHPMQQQPSRYLHNNVVAQASQHQPLLFDLQSSQQANDKHHSIHQHNKHQQQPSRYSLNNVMAQASQPQPLLIDLQPSQLANVLIPHGSTTGIIFSGQNEPLTNGKYFDAPLPYADVAFNTNKPILEHNIPLGPGGNIVNLQSSHAIQMKIPKNSNGINVNVSPLPILNQIINRSRYPPNYYETNRIYYPPTQSPSSIKHNYPQQSKPLQPIQISVKNFNENLDSMMAATKFSTNSMHSTSTTVEGIDLDSDYDAEEAAAAQETITYTLRPVLTTTTTAAPEITTILLNTFNNSQMTMRVPQYTHHLRPPSYNLRPPYPKNHPPSNMRRTPLRHRPAPLLSPPPQFTPPFYDPVKPLQPNGHHQHNQQHKLSSLLQQEQVDSPRKEYNTSTTVTTEQVSHPVGFSRGKINDYKSKMTLNIGEMTTENYSNTTVNQVIPFSSNSQVFTHTHHDNDLSEIFDFKETINPHYGISINEYHTPRIEEPSDEMRPPPLPSTIMIPPPRPIIQDRIPEQNITTFMQETTPTIKIEITTQKDTRNKSSTQKPKAITDPNTTTTVTTTTMTTTEKPTKPPTIPTTEAPSANKNVTQSQPISPPTPENKSSRNKTIEFEIVSATAVIVTKPSNLKDDQLIFKSSFDNSVISISLKHQPSVEYSSVNYTPDIITNYDMIDEDDNKLNLIIGSETSIPFLNGMDVSITVGTETIPTPIFISATKLNRDTTVFNNLFNTKPTIEETIRQHYNKTSISKLRTVLTRTKTVIDTVVKFHTVDITPDQIISTTSYEYTKFPELKNYKNSDQANDDDDDILDSYIIDYNENSSTITSTTQANNYPINNDSIYVVMTDKGKPGIKSQEPPPIFNSSIDYIENTIDYDELIASRDEDDNTNEVNRVLLGGILIASPPHHDLVIEIGNGNECKPECKPSRNEICQTVLRALRCICRPGFARMFPDRPCKPTYTYTINLAVTRKSNERLIYSPELADTNSAIYKNLTEIAHEGIDRMVMQSDFRDIYHGIHITGYKKMNDSSERVIIEFYLQLSDNTNEKRLIDIFSKHLRGSNSSLGGTDLYADSGNNDELKAFDFDECMNIDFNDCSSNAHCFNLRGTYTCSCREGFVDLSENPIYPGRICTTVLIGCEKCNYHGSCLTSGENDHQYCECFHWYTGQNCHVNLKILLIVLITIGLILLTLLIICVRVTCIKRRSCQTHNNLFLVSGKRIMASQVNARRRSNGNSKLDKKSMIEDDFNSETSNESNTLPYVSSTKSKKVKYQTEPKGESMVESGHSQVKDQNDSNFYHDDKSGKIMTIMIPRAKYHSTIQGASLINMESFDRGGGGGGASSLCSTTEAKLLSYLDSSPTTANITSKRKLSGCTNKIQNAHHALPSGALVSAGFEVSATVGYESEIDQKNMMIGSLNSHHAENGDFKTITATEQLIAPSHKYTAESLNLGIDSIVEDNESQFMMLKQTQSTVSEARSYDETLIKPPTKSLHSLYDKRLSHLLNDEANTMAERDLGSTFLLPHTHLYKPDRGSDISGFDSL